MNAYIEITSCSTGFRVSRVNEHFAMFEHRDFSTLEDAQRFAEALMVRDPTLGLVSHVANDQGRRDEVIMPPVIEPAPLARVAVS